MTNFFSLLIVRFVWIVMLILPSSYALAEGKAYFWCVTQHSAQTEVAFYYSKQFLADIADKSKYEEAFHTYIEAHHVKQRFKGGATCQSHNIRGEARRERDESSLTKRELYDNAKVVITDWTY